MRILKHSCNLSFQSQLFCYHKLCKEFVFSFEFHRRMRPKITRISISIFSASESKIASQMVSSCSYIARCICLVRRNHEETLFSRLMRWDTRLERCITRLTRVVTYTWQVLYSLNDDLLWFAMPHTTSYTAPLPLRKKTPFALTQNLHAENMHNPHSVLYIFCWL